MLISYYCPARGGDAIILPLGDADLAIRAASMALLCRHERDVHAGID